MAMVYGIKSCRHHRQSRIGCARKINENLRRNVWILDARPRKSEKNPPPVRSTIRSSPRSAAPARTLASGSRTPLPAGIAGTRPAPSRGSSTPSAHETCPGSEPSCSSRSGTWARAHCSAGMSGYAALAAGRFHGSPSSRPCPRGRDSGGRCAPRMR